MIFRTDSLFYIWFFGTDFREAYKGMVDDTPLEFVYKPKGELCLYDTIYCTLELIQKLQKKASPKNYYKWKR